MIINGYNINKFDNLREANLREANLRGADLEGANLREANLRGAALGGADLEGANLRGADLGGANLRGANLRGANLIRANLEGVNLREANLREANLIRANLRGADLEGADLEGANLREVNLEGADNYNFNINRSDLNILKYQKNKIIAFKFLKYDMTAPYYNTKYKINETYTVEYYNDCEHDNCGSGINVATLEWCLRNTNSDLNHYKYVEVEFDASDIVAIPYHSDGKFRVKKMKILREVPKEMLEKLIGRK